MLLIYLTTAGVLGAEVFTPLDKEAFREARDAAQPGDRIVLPSGELDWGQLYLNIEGTEEAPITIEAPTVYATTLTGSSYMQIAGRHLIIKGIKFIDTTGQYPLWIDGGSHIRVTQCYFEEAQASSLLRADEGIGLPEEASYLVIDHNYFTTTTKAAVTLVAPASDTFIGENLVEHNVFRDAPRRRQGAEALIPYALGKHEGYRTNLTVRYNVFDNWDSDLDSEIVSIKGGGNLFYRNVFAWCNGYFSFRRENDTTVDSNLFYNNAQGMWVYGDGHVITNNIFENCGSHGLYLPDGWYRESDDIEAKAATNCLIANNTWMNTGSRTFYFDQTSIGFVASPSGNTLVNNILYAEASSGGLVVDGSGFHGGANTVENNLYFEGSGSTGPTGTDPLIADPLLVGTGYSIFLEAGSPAIDAGVPVEAVGKDFFGSTRVEPLDIGHHELSTAATPQLVFEMPPIPPDRSGFSDLPLEADFTVFPLEVEVGEAMNLDASISKGEISSYHWNLGDGHTYEGAEAFYPYDWASAGQKTIVLTVTDSNGALHTKQMTIMVHGNGNPVDPWVNTDSWLGWVNTSLEPWWWIEKASRYIYAPDDSGWLYFGK